MTRTSLMRIAMALVAVVLHGCASLPPGSVRDPGDPFERYNRAAFSFNDAVDRAVLKPVAQAYEAVAPSFLRQAVGNFFDNLDGDPPERKEKLPQREADEEREDQAQSAQPSRTP